MTSLELLKMIKSICQAPLGSFPRGGITSSLRVTLAMTPNSVTLKDKKGESVVIRIVGDDKFNVEASSGLGGHSLIECDIERALIFAVDSIVHEEVRRVVREAHK